MIGLIGLGGGGVKGILHIGALLELARHQPLEFPDGVYGSSVGSVIATYIAFRLPIEKMVDLMCRYLSIDAITPPLSMECIDTAFSSKGLYTMAQFEASIVALFDEVGLDIRSTSLGQAPMPLYIIASNIRKGIPTLFSKQVCILDALKCSCCIPGLFCPIELYGQLYVDGNIFVPCVASVMPPGLVLSLHTPHRFLTPSNVASLSPLSYMDVLYTQVSRLFHQASATSQTLILSYPGLQADSDLSEFDIPAILDHAGRCLKDFLGKA